MESTRRQLLAGLLATPVVARAAISNAVRPGVCKYSTGGIVKRGPAMLGFGDNGPETWIPLPGIRLIEISAFPTPPNPDCCIRL
jgi:hypothetical protein